MIEFLKVAASLMAIISCVLVLLSFTKLGKMKVFHFVVGEFAIVTAIAYGFLTALGIGWFAPFGLALWFTTGSVKFAHAAFLATE